MLNGTAQLEPPRFISMLVSAFVLVLVAGPHAFHERAAEIMAGFVGEGGGEMRAGDEGRAQRGVHRTGRNDPVAEDVLNQEEGDVRAGDPVPGEQVPEFFGRDVVIGLNVDELVSFWP